MNLTAQQFNDLYPVGKPFRYYPVSGQSEYLEVVTRSPAWTLGGGQHVVSVTGKSGGLNIANLELVTCDTCAGRGAGKLVNGSFLPVPDGSIRCPICGGRGNL